MGLALYSTYFGFATYNNFAKILVLSCDYSIMYIAELELKHDNMINLSFELVFKLLICQRLLNNT